MFLSSIPVETGHRPDRPRPGMMWLSNPYRVHQRLCMAFDGRKDERVLFRIEGPIQTSRGLRPRILVQSRTEPEWDAAFRMAPFLIVKEDIRVKRYEPSFAEGDVFRFTLRANPTMRKHGEGRPKGFRVGLMSPEDQASWLHHKGRAGGFRRLGDLQTRYEGLQRSRRSRAEDKDPHVHLSVVFSGSLQITDATAFGKTLQSGIGSAKAYGFGLLSIVRVAPLP